MFQCASFDTSHDYIFKKNILFKFTLQDSEHYTTVAHFKVYVLYIRTAGIPSIVTSSASMTS